MKYEHIFLDADNTLLDFDAAQEGAFKGLLSLFGVEYTDEVFARYSEINHGYWRRLELGTVTKISFRPSALRCSLQNWASI